MIRRIVTFVATAIAAVLVLVLSGSPAAATTGLFYWVDGNGNHWQSQANVGGCYSTPGIVSLTNNTDQTVGFYGGNNCSTAEFGNVAPGQTGSPDMTGAAPGLEIDSVWLPS